MPETKYNGSRPESSPEKNIIEGVAEKPETDCVEDRATAPTEELNCHQRRFLDQLVLWQKPDPEISLRKVFLRPFILITYPTVLWACLIYGFSLAWNVIIGATVAQLFAEPYGFNSRAQGLVFLSPFVGSLLGSWLCGPPSEYIANHLTRKNDGIREPEMRLPPVVLSAFLTFFGTLIAGITYHHHTHWSGPVIGFGVLGIGAQMGVSQAMSYALDCHKEVSAVSSLSIQLGDTNPWPLIAFRGDNGHGCFAEVFPCLALDMVHQRLDI